MKTRVPENVPTLFGQTTRDWVDQARDDAARLLTVRQTITIEDVLFVNPRPSYIKKSVTGKIFQDRRFKAVGYTLSKRPAMNSRVIRLWALAEPPEDEPPHKEYDHGD